MVSKEIQDRREAYIELMQRLGAGPTSEIVRGVTETQNELLTALSGVSEADARRSPGEGEWCLRELALHAMFTERLVAKLVEHTARGEMPPAADLEGAGIGMMPKDDGRSYAEVLVGIREMNAAVIAAIEGVPAEPNLEMRIPHPIFGPLNCLEWGAFQRVHDLDHIQHAQRIIAELGA